jgi:3-phenylpropionate/trans-cinnamate dioxygenase ferredoxin subunit
MTSLLVQGAADLKPGEMKKFSISGTDILISNIDGAFYAINNKCTHMGGSLANGNLENGVVTCPKHGAPYDVKTGANVGELSMFFIKKKTDGVKAYPVEIKDGEVYIQI